MILNLRSFRLLVFMVTLTLPFLGIGQTYNSVIYYEGNAPASPKVYHMEQDLKGNIWFLTQQGLSVYNGSQWKTFPDTLQLPREENSRLFMMPDSSVWVFGYNYTKQALFSYKNNKWQEHEIPKIENGVTSLVSDIQWQNGRPVILYSQDGLLNHYDTTWHQYELPGKEMAYRVCIRGDSLFAVVKNDIHHFYNGKLQKSILEKVKSQLPNGKIYNFLYSPSADTLFLLSNKWLGMVVKDNFQLLVDDLEVRRETEVLATNLAYYNPKSILFSIASLPFLYNLVSGEVIPLASGFFDEYTWAHHCFLDMQHNLWISSERGVVKMNSLRFRNFEFNRDKFQNSEVSAIAKLNNTTMILGGNFGYTLFDTKRDKLTRFTFENREENKVLGRVLGITKDSLGNTYMAASNEGLIKLSPEGNMLNKRVFPRVNAVLSHEGKLYFSYEHSRLGLLEGGRVKELKIEDDRYYMRSIVAGSQGNLMILTAAGLMEVDEELEKYNFLFEGKSAFHNLYAYHEYKGQQLFGTLGGLCTLQDGAPVLAQVNGYTLSRPVYSLLTDRKGRLWAGTDRGVFIFSEGKKPLNYDISDGLKGNECNRGALVEDLDGNIWIGTDRGLSIYDPEMDFETVPPPIVSLDLVELSQENINADVPIELGFKSPVAFYFSAASFYEEKSVLYRFRLKGLEDEWRYAVQNEENYVRYAILPSGKYQFEVQAKEENSDWSTLVASATITVNPPFYLTWWFILGSIAVVLLFGFIANALITFKTNEIRLRRTIVEKVNAIRKTENKLRLQNQELTKVNQELDSFVYSVSHDLRSPISSTLGLVNLLKSETNPETQAYYLSLIDTSLQRLDGFIQDIIDLSRNARLEVEVQEIDLSKLITDVFNQQKYNDETGKMKLLLESTDACLCFSDAKRLQVVFNNLISNAIKYRNIYIENPEVKVTIHVNEQEAKVIITDNGIGISPDRLPRIYEMFYRATDHRKGSGLGLYIVKETLDKLGGSISVTSSVGKGSEFCVLLPNLSKAKSR